MEGFQLKEIKITKNEENQRLDKFLLKYMNQAPKSFIYKMLRKKRIKYNGKKAEGAELLVAGDALQLYLAEETLDGFMEEKTIVEAKRHFGITYEDDDILVVMKPAGLLTHSEKIGDKDTLIDQILYYLYEKGDYTPNRESSFTPAVCNRLDRNTSGLIIAGKTLKGVQGVNRIIAEGKLEKYYLTMVKGEMTKSQEAVAYLRKDSANNQVKLSKEEREGSKKVVTRFRPLATDKGYTLLEVQLVTGKSHQIRAHLQFLGYPVVGDRKYGMDTVNEKMRLSYGLFNQFLHAGRIVWGAIDGEFSYLSGKEMRGELPKRFFDIGKDYFSDSPEIYKETIS